MRARFRLADYFAPEGLVAEEGDDHVGLPHLRLTAVVPAPPWCTTALTRGKSQSCSMFSSMKMLSRVLVAEAAPSIADESADAGYSNRFEDELGELVWVINSDAAKAYVDRRRARVEKLGEGFGRFEG